MLDQISKPMLRVLQKIKTGINTSAIKRSIISWVVDGNDNRDPSPAGLLRESVRICCGYSHTRTELEGWQFACLVSGHDVTTGSGMFSEVHPVHLAEVQVSGAWVELV
jgi:hypothetical protein